MSASITITGIDDISRKFINSTSLRTLRKPMDRGMLRLQRDMSKYPPPRPGQTYRRGQDPRSEDLGASWITKITQTAGGMIGRVGNNTSYAPWVQSHQFQAWMHKGRWQTDRDVVERNRAPIMRDFEQEIMKALR